MTTVREAIAQLLGTEARLLAVAEDGTCVAVDELGAADWSAGVLDPLVDKAVRQRVRVVDETQPRAVAYSRPVRRRRRYVLEMRPRQGARCATRIFSSSI